MFSNLSPEVFFFGAVWGDRCALVSRVTLQTVSLGIGMVTKVLICSFYLHHILRLYSIPEIPNTVQLASPN
jgi:hypothetical protein